MENGLVSIGAPIQASTSPQDLSGTITNAKGASSITVLVDGSYVVIWSIIGPDGDRMGVFGRKFDEQNNPIGSEFQVNTFVTADQNLAKVVALADGGFVVVWEAYQHGGTYAGIIGRRFDASGTAVGGEFSVNTNNYGGMYEPDITSLEGGGFVVVWHAFFYWCGIGKRSQSSSI